MQFLVLSHSCLTKNLLLVLTFYKVQQPSSSTHNRQQNSHNNINNTLVSQSMVVVLVQSMNMHSSAGQVRWSVWVQLVL